MSSSSPKARGVLFDLDGTLLDTLRDLADSGNEVLVARGFSPHPIDAYRTFVGSGMANLVRDIFPESSRPTSDAEIEGVLAEYRAAYERNWLNSTAPFPGVAALLDRLVGDRVPLGVVSNKAHDFTLRCVEAFLGAWEWSAVLGHRDGHARKPDPAGALEAAARLGVPPEECLFVGDSDVDMMTARNAGMHAVGVAWGFRSVTELRTAGAATILDEPPELLALLGSTT